MHGALVLLVVAVGLTLQALPTARTPDAPAAVPVAVAPAEGGGAAPGSGQGRQPVDPAAGSCGRCHGEVHAEWSDSAHARAFTDALFQRQLAERRNPRHCLPCHVPGPVLDRLGALPAAREARRDEGVTCAACHLVDGVVHGPNGPADRDADRDAAGAHRLQANAAFGRRGSFGLCSSCHDLAIADVLPLAREFAAAGLADRDLACIGCHMPSTRRAPAADPATGAPLGAVRGGRSHRLLGPADAEFCATAFEVEVARRDGRLLALVGTGAGHGVPGLRLRSFPIRFVLQDDAGRALDHREFVVSWRDRLLVDEVRRVQLPEVAGAVALRVVVDHVLDGERVATVVDRTLELP